MDRLKSINYNKNEPIPIILIYQNGLNNYYRIIYIMPVLLTQK